MITQTLEKLGFSPKEAEIYQAVLQAGKISHARLAKLTGINRSTVYAVVNTLSAKGLITEDLGGKITYVVARPADDLTLLIDKKEKELNKEKQLVHQAIDELFEITKGQEYAPPKIRFIEEDQLEEFLYKQVTVWDKSMLQYDGTWWGFQDPSFVEHYEKWIDWYWQKGAAEGTKLKLLSNEKAEELKKEKFERRQVKFWSKSQDFSATTWVNGDYVIMIVTNKRPHYAVELYDKTLAHNNREVFKNLWDEIG